jgi:hypothetical protein
MDICMYCHAAGEWTEKTKSTNGIEDQKST